MSTSYDPRLSGRELETEITRNWTELMQTAAEVALSPARKLEPVTLRARNLAVRLNEYFGRVANVAQLVIDERARIEDDRVTRADVLRTRWTDFAAATSATIDDLKRSIPTLASEVREALQDAALPVSQDPAVALLARQDVEARLRVTSKSVSNSVFAVFLELAERGGDTAAAVASAWGHDTYLSNGGDDSFFPKIVDAAIATSLSSEDPGRRAAAAALQALDAPSGGQRGQNSAPALTAARDLSTHLLRRVSDLLSAGPVILTK